MKFGVVVFPGSNCDADSYHALKDVMGQEVEYIWHKEQNVDRFDCIILPGGFSYGDYLRCGAIARFSPVMDKVVKFADSGKPVIGICNGFQILTEAGLLPGVLTQNQSLKFICKMVSIRIENTNTPFTELCSKKQVLKIPIAHGDGNYYVGETSEKANPNGSIENIAGICNQQGNVIGMMPHPERAVDRALGSEDGKTLFASVIHYLERSSVYDSL